MQNANLVFGNSAIGKMVVTTNLATSLWDCLGFQTASENFGFFLFLSLFVQRKKQRKGAGNDNFWLHLRLLHKPYWRYDAANKFAPFASGELALKVRHSNSNFFFARFRFACAPQ
jgi:hypothetical protein